MKRKVVGLILGLSVSAAIRSFGTGTIYLSNYYGTENVFPVTYAATGVPPGDAGMPVDQTFSAALYAGLGTISDPSQLTLIPGSVTSFNGFWNSLGAAWNGWIVPAPLISIPGYTSGPVTFGLVAWETSGPFGESFYNLNSGAPVIQGASALWTEPQIPTNAPVTSDPALQSDYSFTIGVPQFTVALVPEPSEASMAGIGVVGLLFEAWRRRKVRR
jgi:hypothetical protein